jgi:glycosyltransferase involved in cell wall biosynthesis
MGRLIFFIAFAATLFVGYGLGTGYLDQEQLKFYPDEVSLVRNAKPFTIVLIGHNDGPTVKRALRSIFEQEYENFRLVFVDDGSRDDTFERVNEFVLANRQEHRVILMKNEISLGFEASLSRASSQCLDAELVLPLRGSDWLSTPLALSRLNNAFQNQKIWVVVTGSIQYPSYGFKTEGLHCFYGALFKRIDQSKSYPKGLLSLTKSKVKTLPDRLLFSNQLLPCL